MNSCTYIELSYRVYLKLTRNVDQMFDRLCQLFLSSEKWCNRVHFSEGPTIYAPITPAKAQDHIDCGFLVFQQNTGPTLAIGQLLILIDCERDHIEVTLDELANDFGDIFAAVRFIESYLTEIVAV